MMEKKFALVEYGPHLWTRERAREVRAQVEEMLRGTDPGDSVVIDAKGVEVFDYSFANELFGKLLLQLPLEFPGRFLVVENLTVYTRENLVKALESLGLTIIERKGGMQLLGKVHPTDQETFEAIVRAKAPVTAASLSSRLDINLTAVNERLAKLNKLGLVRRAKATSTAGRELYEYSVLA